MDNLRGDKNRRAKIFIRACFFQTEESWKENSMKSRFIGGNQYIQDCTIIDDINMLNVFLFFLSRITMLKLDTCKSTGTVSRDYFLMSLTHTFAVRIATRSNEYL